MGFSENGSRFAEQVWNGTVGQIRNATQVGTLWRNRVGTVPRAALAQHVTDGAVSFISNIDRLNTASQDPVKGPIIDAAIAYLTGGEITTAQARNTMGNLRSACVTLRDANKGSNVALGAALDTFIASIPSIPDDIGNETIWT
jgi:hypothetical protein